MRDAAGMAAPSTTRKLEFAGVLSAIQDQTIRSETMVKKGDTLTGIVKDRYRALGMKVDDKQAYREALKLAANNAIADPNRISIGQKISLDPTSPQGIVSSLQMMLQRPGPVRQAIAQTNAGDTLLDKTLQRAADKGFLAAQQITAAKEKIHDMANQFGFDSDHFAMLTLMESNGMDPKADNGRCFGVIQFCEGPASGAASVGMAGKAKNIKNMDLLSQLDLVRQYFSDLGLSASNGPIELDDLYLSVLHPAVRAEKRRDIHLPIPGKQAKDLYVQAQNQVGITRNSISNALIARAKQMFPDWVQGQTSNKISGLLDRMGGD